MRSHGRRLRRVVGDADADDRGHVVALLSDLAAHHEVTPVLSGGDVDADWSRAESSGEEAVGGSEPTPDQDVVDELARALGVEQDADAEFRTTGEILDERDRWRWRLDEEARDEEEGRGRRKRRVA
jgi:uncharacterized protein DUF6335